MVLLRFYGHFAAAYGTLWLVTVFIALVSNSSINTGYFGLIGYPLIALIYAVSRMVFAGTNDLRLLSKRIAELDARLARSQIGDQQFSDPLEVPPYECPRCNMISKVITAAGCCPHCGAVVGESSG